MGRYGFLIDGIRVFLYSPFGADADVGEVRAALGDGEMAVVIRPDTDADFRIECFDKNGTELSDPYIPLSLVSCFLGRVRGLMPVTFEVLYRNKSYDISALSEGHIFSVNLGKCKLLSTKTVEFADGIEIRAGLISADKECICTACYDSDMLDETRLAALGDALLGGAHTPSLAVSYSDGIRIRTVGDIRYYDALTVGLFAIVRQGADLQSGKLTACVNGRAYSLERIGDDVIFYPDIKYLY